MTTEEEIRRLEERLRTADASPSGDTGQVFTELFEPDVFIWGQNGARDLPFLVEAHAAHRPKFSEVKITELKVQDMGTAAWSESRTEYTGQDQKFAIRTVKLWRHSEAGWKVAFAVVSAA